MVCVCASECLYSGTLCRPVLSRYHQAGRKEVEREERRDEGGSESRAFTRGDVLGRGLPGSRMREEPSGCATTSTCCIPCFCSRPVRRTSKEEEKIPAGSSLSPASNSTWLTPLLRIVSSHVSNSWVSSRARAARCGTGSNPSEPSRLHSAAVSCFHKLFRTQHIRTPCGSRLCLRPFVQHGRRGREPGTKRGRDAGYTPTHTGEKRAIYLEGGARNCSYVDWCAGRQNGAVRLNTRRQLGRRLNRKRRHECRGGRVRMIRLGQAAPSPTP